MASPACIGKMLAHYRILEQIGAGGMGVVFRAHDNHLERDVALKILPPGALADETARKRFRREALTLSKLNHPNIASIYDFDSRDDLDFLVMELIPGVTLDEKLTAGPLSEKEVVHFASQIAEGVESAHKLGIIHRDLKPGNLRVSPDHRLKILDFGLAKLLAPASSTAKTESFTDPSSVSGTLPYMAPEQLLGETVDERTDIHAIGAVLYEMASGRRPFADEHSTRLMNAILHQIPASPRLFNSRISAELERIILKCLEKSPENRYQTTRELKVDLRRLRHPAPGSTTAITTTPKRWQIPVAAISIAAIVLATVLLLARWRARSPFAANAEIDSLAVLPLANLSGDAAQEYFADGMTEELTTEVARVGGLRVISRTSVMLYKNARKSLPDIARELNVGAVVVGSVLRSGDQVRITVQLIRAADDTHLWAESYDHDLHDVLGLQKEVARDIAHQIHAKLTPQTDLAAQRKVDPEVHDAYLQGLYHLNKQTEKELFTAIAHFQRAIAEDPSFGLAYAGLSSCYVSLATFYRAPREVMPKAKTSALKALELDDSVSEAHLALGTVYLFYDWDWAAAEREIQRAIALNPNNADAHDLYGVYLIAMGRTDEGLAELQRSYQLDPFSLYIMGDRVFWSYMGRRYDVAIDYGRKAIETEPNNPYARASLALAYAQTGRIPEALAEAEAAHRLDDSPLIASFSAGAYAMAGRSAEAEKMLNEINEAIKTRYSCSYEVAVVYLALGQKDHAFEWFDRALAARSDCMVSLKVDPRLDPVRADPRYLNLLRSVGFAEQ